LNGKSVAKNAEKEYCPLGEGSNMLDENGSPMRYKEQYLTKKNNSIY
jgi:hypothetical protein